MVDYNILPGAGFETTVSRAWVLIENEVTSGAFKLVYSDNGTDKDIFAVPESFKSVEVDIPGDQGKYHEIQYMFSVLRSV